MHPTVRKAALAASPSLRRLVESRATLEATATKLKAQRDASKRRVAQLELENERLRSDAAAVAPAHLFVVTYGRSGSTLLQGILNSIPGYLIRGENGGALHGLHQYHQTMTTRRAKHGGGATHTPENAWYGIEGFTQQASIAYLRAVAVNTYLRPNPDTRVSGFKEIRWWYRDWSQYLDFLDALFPNARYVINTRDHASVIKSKWWAEKEPEQALAQLRSHEERLSEIETTLGDRAFRIHYDDYVNDHPALGGLFEWLGEDLDLATIAEVTSKPHATWRPRQGA